MALMQFIIKSQVLKIILYPCNKIEGESKLAIGSYYIVILPTYFSLFCAGNEK